MGRASDERCGAQPTSQPAPPSLYRYHTENWPPSVVDVAPITCWVFPGGFIVWTFVFLYTKVRRKKVPGLKWTYFTKKDRRDALMMIVNARKEVGCLKKIRGAVT